LFAFGGNDLQSLGWFSDLFFAGKFGDICLILFKLYWDNAGDSGALA
jgi:hypothetical protein